MEVSEVEAPINLLVAAGSLLASLCISFGHIGFLCELSCNIFTTQMPDAEAVLAILHAFAHLCGSQYLGYEKHTVAMTLVKTLVVFLEKQPTSSKTWHCDTQCPFSEGAMSMEVVASLLVEELQKYVSSESWPCLSDNVKNLLFHDGFLTMAKIEEQLSSTVNYGDNICNFLDIISLVELQASFMGWVWTFKNLVNPICGISESLLTENSSVVTIILLGQLGRLGVAANGYNDIDVKKVRELLSAFLSQKTCITALLGLTTINFDDIIEDKVETSGTDQTIPLKSIREWFFCLNHEQQALFTMLHTSSNKNLGN